MAETREIEFKCMISEDEYQKISTAFSGRGKIIKQINHYFETKDRCLKMNRYSLRVRNIMDDYELTLKTPLEIGVLETNIKITKNDFELMKNHNIPSTDIKNKLMCIGVEENDLYYITSLTTIRQEIILVDGILCIDYNTYSNTHDFELEFEVSDPIIGKRAFSDILNELGITFKRSKQGKMNRTINAKVNE